MNLKKMLLGGLFLFLIVPSFQASGVGLESFSATALLPLTQKKQNIGYFDLEMKENQSEKVMIRLTNHLEQPLRLHITFQRARTTNSGTIFYDKVKKESYSANPDIENYVSLSEREIELAPLATNIVSLAIKMPKEKFKGVLAGGIVIQEKAKAKITNDNIEHLYSREIALLLQNSSEEPATKLAINHLKVKSDNLQFSVENQGRMYLKKVTLTYYLKKEKERLLETSDTNFKIAPQTSFTKKITLPDNLPQGGKYQLEVIIESEGQQLTQLSHPFIVNPERVEKIKQKKDTNKSKPTYLLSVFLFFCPVIIFLFIKWQNNDKLSW